MGVVNVTPDSFSDGGLWLDAGAAIAHGAQLHEEGAAILDVGGESTRPGAEPVGAEEELRRVVPVLEGNERRVLYIGDLDHQGAQIEENTRRVLVHEAGERLWQTRFSADPALERMRFDVASVTFLPDGAAEVEHIRAAF